MCQGHALWLSSSALACHSGLLFFVNIKQWDMHKIIFLDGVYIYFYIWYIHTIYMVPPYICHINMPLYIYCRRQWHPHSSTLAWKIPWAEGPGRLQSMGSPRVGPDWATSLSLFTFMHWRRKWQPTPVFLPGESQGWGRLVGCRLWGRTESDMTEVT